MAVLEGLNDQQREAVLQKNGPLLIIAGAGSGKTKTIAHRIAYLISEGVRPDRILAVTFTNKAAQEMKERVVALARQEKIRLAPESMPFLGTFHALGAQILRSHGLKIGISKRFSILDTEDTRVVIRDIIKEFELDPEQYAPARIRDAISHLKNELIDASEFARQDNPSPYQKNLRALYAAYEARLAKMNGLDFDDLLLKTVLLFEDSPEARAHYEKRWHYVHIDEYQDTNRAQYSLSRTLAHTYGNIVVVGDIDQAIYSWRGADWRNILQFEKDWPHARLITLEKNYRSTKVILEAANAVIVNNTERKEKNLWSDKEKGAPLQLVLLENERQEAMFIAEYARGLKQTGLRPESIAVLFRTNAQSRAIEEAFLKKNIPYRLLMGVKFYERKEVKDVLAYIKYALNESDIIAKKRILNTPPRGIGKVLTLKYLSGSPLDSKSKEKIKKFETIMAKIGEHAKTKKAATALKAIMREAGFDAYYKDNKFDQDRKENIQELISVAQKFDAPPAGGQPPEGLEMLLTEAALMTQETEIEDKDSQVILLTAHAAKGLEFDAVIIAGMEEGLFPHSLSETQSELEEERRLFYVALTRAREKILITLTRHRMIYGEVSFNDPSRFLGEIPDHLISGSFDEPQHREEDEISIL